ncbi:MAG: hypothetical protein LKF96_09960 [Treponema sp.]|jgi:hypothetical protein|nr:hypothetical protein [Treponema sp.]
MTVKDIEGLIDGTCVQSNFKDASFSAVYSSDLLSDVLANCPDGAVLVTVQAHQNTIAVASMKDIPAVIVCNDRPIPPDMLTAAAEESVAVFVTPLDQFTVDGRLYTALKQIRK